MGNDNSSRSSALSSSAKSAHTGSLASPGEKSSVQYCYAVKKRLELLSQKQNPDLAGGTVLRSVFKLLFDDPSHRLGGLLHDAFSKAENDSIYFEENDVKTGLKQIQELSDDSAQSDYYFKVFAKFKEFLTQEDLQQMAEVLYAVHVSQAAEHYHRGDQDAKFLSAVVDSALSGSKSLNAEQFCRWRQRTCPSLLHSLHGFVLGRAQSAEPCEASETAADSDELPAAAMRWLMTLTLPLIYSGADVKSQSSAGLCSHWKRLYCTNADGTSFHRLKDCVLDYKGITCVLLYFEGGNTYCCGVDSEWRDSAELWGGVDCCCVQLTPRLRPVERGEKMLSFNGSSRAIPKGLRVGRNPRICVLDVNWDMDTIRCYGVDYKLNKLQVWGCAGAKVHEAQRQQRKWEQKQAEKQRDAKLRLDVGETWDDNPDRQLLQWGGVGASANR